MNAPVSAADALPNAEAMLEEIERKQRELHGRKNSIDGERARRLLWLLFVETKNKSGSTTTPLLEYLKQKREERKQVPTVRCR
jgi:hypothetical protein